ncbi:MAG: hypothetical protein M3Z19_03080 [Chloroflexota bacterium]|nr:hypothetical protein [Chloroflexota bacterium]
MKKQTWGWVAVGALIVTLAIGTTGLVMAGGFNGLTGRGGQGPSGMMQGSGQNGSGYPGAMPGGTMQGGPSGMMNGSGGTTTTGNPVTIDQAQQAVQTYLDRYGNANLAVDEMMGFQDNFYAIVKEKDTGTKAFEVLIDRNTGTVFPEYGPNMMWNTKYGMMRAQYNPLPMTVTPDQATQNAAQWLAQNQSGAMTETPDTFYGYYTLHIMKDGKVTGMLSVNGYTGQVWYHNWHGDFIQMKEAGA